MKTKIVSMVLTEDEYNSIHKAVMEASIKEGKRVSMSAYASSIVIGYINGNQPLTHISNKDSKQEGEQEVEQEGEQHEQSKEESSSPFDYFNNLEY